MYANALPASFNTRYENSVFLTATGEFITRQFREGRIPLEFDGTPDACDKLRSENGKPSVLIVIA